MPCVLTFVGRFCRLLTPFCAVDAAAKEADPLRRIAYVGAFAMSNYSSTIGRIAKPFNPMLVGPHFLAYLLGRQG